LVYCFTSTKAPKMLTCIAIDDEELALDLLEDNIRRLPFLKMLGRFRSPVQAIQFLQQQEIDLVFLDIQMPHLSGLELIQSLTQKPMFILVTAYKKFALDGFNLNVVDYLLKPVPLDRFIQACNKAWELHKMRKWNVTNEEISDHMFLQVDYSLQRINFADIIWVEGLRDYIKLHFDKGAKPVVARISMKAMEGQLPASLFIRIHKSYIVSKKHITAIRRNSLFLDKIELNIGDTYKPAVAQLAGRPLE
ncbi:MAG: LytR/AlgR family response regulator transcription factor, partial [Chitinophagaceae bacterium]